MKFIPHSKTPTTSTIAYLKTTKKHKKFHENEKKIQ